MKGRIQCDFQLSQISKSFKHRGREQDLSEQQTAGPGSCCHNKHAAHNLPPMCIFTVKHNKGIKHLVEQKPHAQSSPMSCCSHALFALLCTQEQAYHCTKAMKSPLHKVSISFLNSITLHRKESGILDEAVMFHKTFNNIIFYFSY